MRQSLMKFFTVAAITALGTSTALAWNWTCYGGYNVGVCNDGTIVRCVRAGGGQFDCPTGENAPDMDSACEDHGGFRGWETEPGECVYADDEYQEIEPANGGGGSNGNAGIGTSRG